MIEIKRVSKVYRLKDREVVAVDDVSLTIEDGDIYGIIGYSGAGKSTLVRLINQLEVQDSGKIFIDGQDLGNLSQIELRKLRTKVGMIFQHFNLLWSRTVSENIELALEIAGNKDKRPYQWKHMIRQRICRRNTKETRYVMLKIWEQLLEQNRELFSDCGPFCMNGGCEEGKMTCGKSIPPQMLPTDIIRVDFPKLCEESVLEEGVPDEDTAD